MATVLYVLLKKAKLFKILKKGKCAHFYPVAKSHKLFVACAVANCPPLSGPVRKADHLSFHESQSRKMENTVCRKLGARCDSQIDSHRRCSGATWVRSWNVAPRPAGVFMSCVSLTRTVLVHPWGGESRKLLTRSFQFPCQATAMTWIPALSLLTSDLEPLAYAQSSFRGGMTLQTFRSQLGWKLLLPKSLCTRRGMCGRRWEAQRFGRLVIWVTGGYKRLKAAVVLKSGK